MPLIKPVKRSEPPVITESESLPLADLVSMLGSDLAETRQSALGGLTAYLEAAIPLCHQLELEQDAPTREMIAVVLSRMGSAKTVEELLPLLRSDNATLRNTVIDILKLLPTDVAPHMETLLDDPDPDVRIFAVNILETLLHPKVEDLLIAVISVDAHVNVVETALDLMGEVGNDAALPALAVVNTRFPGEPFIAFAVNNALKQIQSAG